MSEPIKELAQKAITDSSGKWVRADQLEEYTKLVVQECITNVKVWEKDSRNHISYMLKNHYGVNE